jgi:mRNA interferase MazF
MPTPSSRPVVPITSNVDRVYPFQVLIPAGTGGLPDDCKAQAEQVRSIDAERIEEQLGRLPDQLMTSLDDALRLHLALRAKAPVKKPIDRAFRSALARH